MKYRITLMLILFAIQLIEGSANQPRYTLPLGNGTGCIADQTAVQSHCLKKSSEQPAIVLNITTSLLSDISLLPSTHMKENPTSARANELMQQSGIRFQENKGQIVDTDGNVRNDIAFIANAPGARLHFRNDGISYVFTKTPEDVIPAKAGIQLDEAESGFEVAEVGSESYRLDMTLVGSNPHARVRAEGELPGYVNYYLPQCPNGITGIKEYSRIIYENVYNNVDLELFSVNGKMKYNFIVRPGGDVSNIKMKYDGASETALMKDGALAVVTPLGRIEEATPYTYSNNESNEVYSRFLRKGNTVSFAVDDYDQTQTLVIDPWATYYGGSGNESSNGIAVDANGNIIISGTTSSTNFPVSIGAYQTTNEGGEDVFVVKFDANGARLWATYYGGSSNDHNGRVTTDVNGNIMIAGYTESSNFPVTAGSFQTTYAGNGDLFAVKFNASGSRQWATFYGGSKYENWGGMGADLHGNILITGSTASTNFPVSSGAFQTSKSKGTSIDAFALKINNNGTRAWATYYGGNNSEHGNSITADLNGNVYMTGFANTNFPVTVGAYQTTNAGGTDAFIVKFSESGVRLWATYFGGNSNDVSRGVTTDNNGNVIISGYTTSTNFPVTAGAFQTSYGGGAFDVIVAKFTANGSRIWATYCGGNNNDTPFDVTTDTNGNIIFVGTTYSPDFPVSPLAYQTLFAGGPSGYSSDAFIVKFDVSGSREWGTFYGGNSADHALAVSRDASNNVLFTGATYSTNFSLYGASYQVSNAGGSDTYIVVLNSNGLFAKRSLEQKQIPLSVVLEQNFPNPFNPTTTITFSLTEEMSVHLSVFDALGREIKVLTDQVLIAGQYFMQWNAEPQTSTGVYTVRLVARSAEGQEILLQRQMMLMK